MTDKALYVDMFDSAQGHRGQYAAMLPPLIDGRRVTLTWDVVLARQPILISMIEESFSRFVLVGLVRALIGRVTAGLLFRPLPAVRAASFKLKVKHRILQALKLIGVRSITILPFSVEPRFAEIAASWIYDPQFWDLYAPGAEPVGLAEGPLAREVREKAAGRRICCAIGRQDQDKGFDHFVRLWLDNPELREQVLFVCGGKVSPNLAALADEFAAAGGLAYNRFITDEELFDLYAVSDMIWACYAESYDQASGIFGRAMQQGIPVILRASSLIHRFCQRQGLSYVALGPDTAPAAMLDLPPRGDVTEAVLRGRAMANESVARLRAALGLAPQEMGDG